MKENVSITICYTGHFAQLLGCGEDRIEVPPLLSEARQAIADYLSGQKQVSLPYTLLLNERAVSLVLKNDKNRFLEEGDRFRIVPVTTGG